jgi:PhnB protein
MFIPAGFATIAPYLVVEDAADYVDFLVDGLGGVHVGTSADPDGRIANAQVRFGDGTSAATVMISDATDDFPPGTAALYLYVADADAAMARAVDAGATAISPVADMPYGDRQGGVIDEWGMTWWISQRLTAEPYSF